MLLRKFTYDTTRGWGKRILDGMLGAPRSSRALSGVGGARGAGPCEAGLSPMGGLWEIHGHEHVPSPMVVRAQARGGHASPAPAAGVGAVRRGSGLDQQC